MNQKKTLIHQKLTYLHYYHAVLTKNVLHEPNRFIPRHMLGTIQCHKSTKQSAASPRHWIDRIPIAITTRKIAPNFQHTLCGGGAF